MNQNIRIPLAGLLAAVLIFAFIELYPNVAPVFGQAGIGNAYTAGMLLLVAMVAFLLVFGSTRSVGKRAILSVATAALNYGILLLMSMTIGNYAYSLPSILPLVFNLGYLTVAFTIAACVITYAAKRYDGANSKKSPHKLQS